MRKLTGLIIIILMMIISAPAYASASIDISSEAAILMDLNTGKVLYEKNPDEKLYPASTTKIMTAMLVLEKCNLTDKVIVGKNPPHEAGSSIALQPGEELTVKDLLYAMMLESANDTALALAEHVSGSKEAFAELMNKTAADLGCKSTHFVNPNGLYDENHYTTARDLCIIAKRAMENPEFRKIVSTLRYQIAPTNKQPVLRYINNLNKLMGNTKYKYKGANGIKNGYTSQSKNTLVASASRDNLNLIAVVLKADHGAIYKDASSILDYGFANFTCEKIVSKDVPVFNITLNDKSVPVYPAYDYYLIVKKGEHPRIDKNTILSNDIKKLSKGKSIGYLEILTHEGIQSNIPLVCNEEYNSLLYQLRYTGDKKYKKVFKPNIKLSIALSIFLSTLIIFLIVKKHKKARKIFK